jgi:hypothetical protein
VLASRLKIIIGAYFLIKNGVFLIILIPFLHKNILKIVGEGSFLRKNDMFLIILIPFLRKNNAKIIRNVSFLIIFKAVIIDN